EEKKLALNHAFSTWAIKTENVVRFDVLYVPTEYLRDNPNIKHTFFVFNRNPTNPDYIGFTTWNKGAVIEIHTELPIDTFTMVAMHEIGHALDLHHYEGPNKSIMGVNANHSDNVECQDIINFCDAWNCDIPCELSE